jgi:N-acyl-L-homoserine lactone synthetase
VTQLPFSDAIAAAADEMTVEIASTQEQVLEAQRLRHKVYCQERGFEPGCNGLEQDEFDGHSHHVLVRSVETATVFATARVVCATPSLGKRSFPMQRVCDPDVLARLPSASSGEISRFAITRDRAGLSPAAVALMRLFLMRGILAISGQQGLTHWCAMMEDSLLRLLRATSIHFQPSGPSVEHHGRRQPAVAEIGRVMRRSRHEQPLAWSFCTNDGALWSEPLVLSKRQA